MTIMSYKSPYTITEEIVSLVAAISEEVGKLSVLNRHDLRLRRINRIRTIRGTLAIEGNTLSEEQITAIINGTPVIAPPREIQEVRNALSAYKQLSKWRPEKEKDFLAAHEIMMQGLIDDCGQYRQGDVGVMGAGKVLHMAPPAHRVPELMQNLFNWLKTTSAHPLISSSVFHYELEFIHPFSDGNGRMGRLWQTLILSQWQPILIDLPVESIVHAYQQDYYQAIKQSTMQTDAAPFIIFMLSSILETCRKNTPQVTLQVSPQVKQLLLIVREEMSREELMKRMKLKDIKHFRQRYLNPAIKAGLLEMTQPQTPRSPTQRYRLTKCGQALVKQWEGKNSDE